MRFLFFAVLGQRIKAIVPMMKDPAVRKRKKLIIILGVVYLLLPIDLIPPIVPVFGWLDDLILWLFIIHYLRDELDKYWLGDKKTRGPYTKYRGKNIIEVDFEVKEVKKEEKEETDEGEHYDR